MPGTSAYKFLLTILLLSPVVLLHAQNPTFVWAKTFRGNPVTAKEYIRSMTTDAAGNVYTTGYFTLTVDFDPGPGVYNLTSPDTDLFIAKLDPAGNLLWVKQIGGTVGILCYNINLDPSGNILVTGTFNSPTDFDPGPGVNILNNSLGLDNTFILKLDNNGNFTWAKNLVNLNNFDNSGVALKADAAGNILLIGFFRGSIDVDPGPAIVTLSDVNNGSLLLLKLDAGGNYIWAKQIPNASPFGITLDISGPIYITGFFTLPTDFDPGPGVQNRSSLGSTDIFILKLTAAGDFIWVKTIGSFSSDTGTSITTDDVGNIYATGNFFNQADFDPGPAVYNLTTGTPNTTDTYILKLNAQGELIWAKAVGGGSQTIAYSIKTDNQKNVYITGHFWGTGDFDPGPADYFLSAGSSYNCYILKLNPSGNFAWVKFLDGGLNGGVSIAVDPARNVYTAGNYFQIVDFDPGPAFFYMTAAGNPNGFVHKMRQLCSVNTFSILDIFSCDDYILNDQVFTSSGTYTQVIANATGCDSTITINLVIGKKSSSIDTAICEGQTYFAGGAAQTTAGIYKDTLLTTLGCDSVITTNLTVHPKPTPDLGADRKLCQNTSTIITPGIFPGYSWNDLSTGATLPIDTAGIYWVTVKDILGCIATDSLTIISVDSIPTNFLPPAKKICPAYPITISMNGYKDYLWSNGSSSSSIEITSPGDYYLNVTDNNDCAGRDTISITKDPDCLPFGIPNAFTPNGDGLNDIFKPVINQTFTAYSFSIYNRFGEKIFETKKYPGGWNGTYKGKPQGQGTYVYFISYIADNGWHAEERGTFLLIR